MNEARYTPEEQKQIAETILSQFAGGRAPAAFAFSVGVKNIVALDGGVQFGLKPCVFNTTGVNRVKVILTPRDEYDLTFSKVNRDGKETIFKTHEGIYCDQLADLFYDATGLFPYLGYSPRAYR